MNRPEPVERKGPLPRVLVVEDEDDIRTLVRYNLEQEGFAVNDARDGAEGYESIHRHPPDALVLDLMLPGMSGLELCQKLRAEAATRSLPIVMLTAKSSEVDRILGLEMGADDYVVKPFSPRELLARVRAALRHTARTPEVQVVSFDTISVDFKKMEVKRDGQPVVLTAQEFKTFQFLVQNADRVISRDELLNEVWGYQNYPSTRTVDNHILKLRQKLERDPSSPVHFRTVHGMGYKFVR
jgi:DNA-binding response OmpR family regulator